MEYLALTILSLTLVFCFLTKEKAGAPLYLFTIEWIIIVFLSILSLYEIDKTSQLVYYIVSLGSSGFISGCVLVKFLFPYQNKLIENQQSEVEDQIRYKIVYAFCFISIIFLFRRALRVNSMLFSGAGMGYLRLNFATEVLSSNFEVFLDNFLIHPGIFALIPIMAVHFLNTPNKWFLPAFTLINIFLYAYCDAGRIIILFIIFHTILVSIIWGNKQSGNRIRITQEKKLVIYILFSILAVLGYLFINYLTIARGSGEKGLGEQVYIYFCGCLPHLSIRIKDLIASNTHSYGMAFFGGIIESMLILLHNTRLLGAYPEAFLRVKSHLYVEDFVNIGSQNFNAFVTPYYYFYSDFGMVGVLICSFVYGCICQAIFSHYQKNKDIRSLIAYLLLSQSIFLSMVRWQFYQVTFTLTFVYIFLFIKSTHPKSINDSDEQ